MVPLRPTKTVIIIPTREIAIIIQTQTVQRESFNEIDLLWNVLNVDVKMQSIHSYYNDGKGGSTYTSPSNQGSSKK